MTRAFTKREKILLLVLVVLLLGAVYYFFVAKPSLEKIEQAHEQTTALQDELLIEIVRMQQIINMQEEIEKAMQGEERTALIPAYDNLENVMKQLDDILSSATEYSLAFQPVTEEGSMIYRPIEVVFQTSNYSVGRDIINQIYMSPYRCVIDSIGVDNVEQRDEDIARYPIEVTMEIAFIEKRA